MKSLFKYLFIKTSVVEVLAPFFKFFNFVGLCTISLEQKNFKISTWAAVAFVVNFLTGIYYFIAATTIKDKTFNLMEAGVVLIFNSAILSSLLILVLNFSTQMYLRKLIRALIDYDTLSKKDFTQKNQ